MAVAAAAVAAAAARLRRAPHSKLVPQVPHFNLTAVSDVFGPWRDSDDFGRFSSFRAFWEVFKRFWSFWHLENCIENYNSQDIHLILHMVVLRPLKGHLKQL